MNWKSLTTTEKQDLTRKILSEKYLKLRVWVGLLAFALPIVLFVVGGTGEGGCGQAAPAISAYYHTSMRDIFVGVIFIIGTFLLIGGGLDTLEERLNLLAGGLAIPIALFPTKVDNADLLKCMEKYYPLFSANDTHDFTSFVHYLCASGFFVTLIVIVYCVFRHKGKNLTNPQKLRNKIFMGCTIAMGASILTIFVYTKFLEKKFQLMQTGIGHEIYAFLQRDNCDLVFWGETIALFAFGIAWLTKGNAIKALADLDG